TGLMRPPLYRLSYPAGKGPEDNVLLRAGQEAARATARGGPPDLRRLTLRAPGGNVWGPRRGLTKRIRERARGSSNGRTAAFGAAREGSNPSPRTGPNPTRST